MSIDIEYTVTLTRDDLADLTYVLGAVEATGLLAWQEERVATLAAVIERAEGAAIILSEDEELFDVNEIDAIADQIWSSIVGEEDACDPDCGCSEDYQDAQWPEYAGEALTSDFDNPFKF